MKILWKTYTGEHADKKGKQHGFIPKKSLSGDIRNISLCGRYRQLNEDCKAELFENMDGDFLDESNACKTCLKKYKQTY